MGRDQGKKKQIISEEPEKIFENDSQIWHLILWRGYDIVQMVRQD